MVSGMTRRKAIGAGAAAAGVILSPTGIRPSHAWPPGPDENLKRNLTPGKTPVRLACSDLRIHYPQNQSMTEMVKHIRESGYTSASTATNKDARNPLLDATDAEITELRAACKKYDVTIFDVMTWSNQLHPDPEIRKKAIRYVTESIEVAERIGCLMVTSVTGSCHPDSFIGIHPGNWTAETWKLTVKTYSQILRDTAGMKASLGMEAVVTTNLDGVKAHLRLIEDVGDPRCAVCLDPTNMVSLANYYHTTELLDECFDKLGEKILGCHAKDPYILPDKMLVYVTEVAPGKGVMDYETYLVRLSRMAWPRTLFLEHLPSEEYPGVKAFIEGTASKVGVKIYG
ncbi:sugar phosphate isomerase/epimerase [bacterium]|nr:sugar phosphate isomerase/epimerase [bacterium]